MRVWDPFRQLTTPNLAPLHLCILRHRTLAKVEESNYYILDVFLLDGRKIITSVAITLKIRQHIIRVLEIQNTSSNTKRLLNKLSGPPSLSATMPSNDFYVRTQDGCLSKHNQFFVCMSTLLPFSNLR